MLCNFSAQCNQCNFRSSMARYMRKHTMMMHSGGKRPQGGDSLTNCLEVRPTMRVLCTRVVCTRIPCISVLLCTRVLCTTILCTRVLCIRILCTRVLCTSLCTRVLCILLCARVVWVQESRLGEMGIGGGRRQKNALASPPGTIMHPPKLEQCNLKAAVQQ